ncbi:MAG: FlgO family outer membrane protein [Candidatus Acidiferrales bacterium]
MESESQLARHLRFGAFEVDLVQRELRRQGLKIKLNEKPFQVLQVLLERAGEVVRREDLRQRLWSADTYVDFDANMNTALSNLRRSLGDSTENPAFIETVPRQGYRFIAPVSRIEETPRPASDAGSAMMPRAHDTQAIGSPVRRDQFPAFVSAAVLLSLFLALGAFAYLHWGSRSAQANAAPRKLTILVTPFENLSGDPSQNYLSDGLTDEMITRLGQTSPDHLGVIARSTAMEYQGQRKSLDKIVREQRVDYILEGTFQRQDDHVRITAQLYKASDLSSVWAEQYERDATDLLAIQSDVANRITQSLSLKLLPPNAVHNAAVTPTLKAYGAD